MLKDYADGVCLQFFRELNFCYTFNFIIYFYVVTTIGLNVYQISNLDKSRQTDGNKN